MGNYSHILITEPGFSEGAGRILDFGDSLTTYNFAQSSDQADQRALWADWMAIGEDMRQAYRNAGIDVDRLEASALNNG